MASEKSPNPHGHSVRKIQMNIVTHMQGQEKLHSDFDPDCAVRNVHSRYFTPSSSTYYHPKFCTLPVLSADPLCFDTTIPDLVQLCHKHTMPFCGACAEKWGEVESLQDATARFLAKSEAVRLPDGSIKRRPKGNSMLERMRK